ncbi:MAG: hypothetical protein ACI9IV_000371 [Paracoccaceae bacterium]|jgi:hypothetical protein
MTANVGTIDRVLRAILGILLIALPFVSDLLVVQGPIGASVSVIVGLVMLATSAMRFCPLYRIMGVRTCKP